MESRIHQPDDFQTLVVLDTETTGLKSPSITELAMIAIPFTTLPQCDRAQDVLVVCANPTDNFDHAAEKMSGLSNEVLEKFKPFNADLFGLADSFFQRQAGPILVVAHNGFAFDYGVLKNEGFKTNVRDNTDIGRMFLNRPDVFLADSWIYFREEDVYEDTKIEEDSPSAKLKRFTMDSPAKSGSSSAKDEHEEEKCHACVASPSKVQADECLCSSDDSDLLSSILDQSGNAESPENPVTPVKRKILSNMECADTLKTPPKRKIRTPRMFSRPQGYFKLTKIYERFFGSEPPIAHTALEDCKTLLKVLSYDHKNFMHRFSSELNLIVDSGFPSRTIRKFADIDFYSR